MANLREMRMFQEAKQRIELACQTVTQASGIMPNMPYVDMKERETLAAAA